MTMSKNLTAVISVAAVLGLAATQQACSSSDNSGTPTPTAGSGGAAATAGAGAGGAAATAGAGAGGSSAGAGGSSAGAGAAAAGAGGSSAGAGGSSAGAGGSSAGAGGSRAGAGGTAAGGTGGGSAGSAGSGGATVAFSDITTLFSDHCASCHSATTTGKLNYSNAATLYSVLTTAIPGADTCAGSTLVVPGNTTTSFLLTAVKTGGACPVGGGTIGHMPLGCTTTCLTTAQIATISDWIAEGAPH
jgi:hypothetical protein